MSLLRFKYLETAVTYTGRELRSGWVRGKTALEGDAAAVFTGPCHVATSDLVDMEDAAAGATIAAGSMAHVVVEHHDCTLQVAVLRQRLLVSILCEILTGRGIVVRRDGDDVYAGDRKLTVSIAAPSKHSCLIHLGINIDPDGAPVAAVGLEELGVDAVELLKTLLENYGKELEGVSHAQKKVRTVE